MAVAFENIGHIISMLLLLGCSAFFSGVETAYFNLSRRQITLLQKSKHKLQKLAGTLLNNPGLLLSSILFGNMMVNVLYFAVSSTFVVRVQHRAGTLTAAVTACTAFCILVLLGEIFPKSLAYANSKPFAVSTSVPLVFIVKIFGPVQSVLRFLIVEPFIRLILGPTKNPEPVSIDEFKSLINQVQKRDLITTEENRLLAEVAKLGFLKVRDCLQPRVDLILCPVTHPPQTACKLMQKNQLTKLPVYAKAIDNIIGIVKLRRILLNPDTSLDKLVEKVNFVPEQKTIESLLDFFRQTRTDTAIVVDEYGGIAGSISLEDIAEELIGPIESMDQTEPIKKIGPFEYRLAGNLALHDWIPTFSIDTGETRVSTIGGYVTALLGRIPKENDIVHLNNLKFTVEKMRKHRVETLILTLEPLLTNDK